MIHLPASVRVYLATSPCDMRRSFDGLHALVNAVMQIDAFAGHLFVFSNRRRNQARFRIPIGFRGCRVPLASSARETTALISKNRPRRNCSRSR